MKIPGPDHPITLTRAKTRWQARLNGQVVADSGGAIVLAEAAYPQVIYFPRADIIAQAFAKTPRSTHCPYKGDASYFTVAADGATAENAAWSYETPFPAMEAITDHIAFYPSLVEVAPVRGG